MKKKGGEGEMQTGNFLNFVLVQESRSLVEIQEMEKTSEEVIRNKRRDHCEDGQSIPLAQSEKDVEP